MNIVNVKNLSKIYNDGENKLYALKNINLSIEKGEMLAVMGASGSGKSTLLNILGCIDSLTEGEYYFQENLVDCKKESELSKLRREKIGFIFQNYSLIPSYNVIQNVMLSLQYKNLSASKKINKKDIKDKAIKVLTDLGLENKIYKFPLSLSGGEQQRVAIARALSGEKTLILADEPTGALDKKNGEQLLKILKEVNESGVTIVLVTHDENVANKCKRIISLEEGSIIQSKTGSFIPGSKCSMAVKVF